MNRYKSQAGQILIHESYDQLLSDWNVPHEQQDIMTSYGNTHVIIVGEEVNPPLLLLHGVGDNSAMMWIYNIEHLSKQFYVIAVDAIGGSGKSEPNEHYWKAFDQTIWLDEVLESLKIEETSIAGVSYGAYLAYHYAIMRPSKVKKIVCMAGVVASSHGETIWKMIKAFLPEALFPTKNNTKRLLKKLCGPNYKVFENNNALMNHWYYLLKYFNNKSMQKHKTIIFNNTQIQSIREKSLFIIGEQDILSYYPKAIHKLQENHLNYKIVKQAGHAVNHEQAAEINAELSDYLLA